MARIIDRIYDKWRYASVALRLIAVNSAVFLALRIAAAANIFTGDRSTEQAALRLVELPADMSQFLARPWTIVTYMFAQFDVFHFIFNMLWLYWFGLLLTEILPSRRTLGLYLGAGLVGGLTFMAGSALLPGLPEGGVLIGSSASVLAIVTATALLMPDREIGLLFIGGVKLKWVALAMILLDFINIGTGNTGGHIAHLTGAITGAAFAICIRRESSRRNRRCSAPARPATSPEVATASTRPSDLSDSELDRILDKIRQSGYASLTADERRNLIEISQRLRERKEQPTTR